MCPKFFSRMQAGLNIWEIVGIAVGSAVFLAIVIVLIVCCVKKGKGGHGSNRNIRMRVR